MSPLNTGAVGAQVNGGQLPPHVVPFCVGGALLAAAIPLISELLQRLLSQAQLGEGNVTDAEGEGVTSSSHRAPSRLRHTSGAERSSWWARLTEDGEESVSTSSHVWVAVLKGAKWLLPSGIGFAVGMYVSPRWTIPRVVGSAIEQVWLHYRPDTHRSLMVIVASGLVLGEGTASILAAAVKAAFG